MSKTTIGILIFDDVEVLDFTGPFEVFSRTRLSGGSRRNDSDAPLNVVTIAKTNEPIVAVGGLKVTPHCSFASAPELDILLVPGGFGTRALLNDRDTLRWIMEQARRVSLLSSVCTGALLYAKCGLLNGRRATTHWAALEELAGLDPSIQVESEHRYVDDQIVTSAGVSAGIDMALYLVAKLCGQSIAVETARYIDYPLRESPI